MKRFVVGFIIEDQHTNRYTGEIELRCERKSDVEGLFLCLHPEAFYSYAIEVV